MTTRSKPKVSVSMATRNYGLYIEEAIQSVLQQNDPDWELIIVDDDSNDDTPKRIYPYLRDARIRYFRSSRLGVSRAKNLAIHLAKADRIAFLDADDRWLPDKLEKQNRLLDQQPNIAMVFTDRYLIDPEGKRLQRLVPDRQIADRYSFEQILIQNPICFSSVMIRRSILEHLGGFCPDLEKAVDYELWLRLARYYDIVCLEESLVEYRTGHANLSARVDDRLLIVLSVLRKSLTLWGNRRWVDRDIENRAWSSTYRSLGFALREKSPYRALSHYLQAWRYDFNHCLTLRSLLALAWVQCRSYTWYYLTKAIQRLPKPVKNYLPSKFTKQAVVYT